MSRRTRCKGTACEVRRAALPPWRRDELAGGLRVARIVGKPRSADRRQAAELRRRDAMEDADWLSGFEITLTDAVAIKAMAAARAAGQTVDAFVSEWVVVGIEATRDGLGLKFTRQERAALARMKEWQGSSLDYSALTESVNSERGRSRQAKCEPSTAKELKR